MILFGHTHSYLFDFTIDSRAARIAARFRAAIAIGSARSLPRDGKMRIFPTLLAETKFC